MVQQSIKTCRATELLDELANILCNLYSFYKENDLEFASTIVLLNRYWDHLKERTDNN
jgi:tRNA-binding EMAP/Myf-like protein